MKNTSTTKPKIGVIKVDPRRLNGLPRDVAGIEKWIKQIGGREPGLKERTRLRQLGLIGMPRD